MDMLDLMLFVVVGKLLLAPRPGDTETEDHEEWGCDAGEDASCYQYAVSTVDSSYKKTCL